MNCQRIQKEISVHFASGESGFSPEVGDHIESCASCAAFAAELKSLRGILDKRALDVKPGELDDITFEKIAVLAGSAPEKVRRPIPLFGRLIRWAWVPATVSTLILLAILYGGKPGPADSATGYTDTGIPIYNSQQQLIDQVVSSDSLGTEFLVSLAGEGDDLSRAADELFNGADLNELLDGLTADELKSLYSRLDDFKG